MWYGTIYIDHDGFRRRRDNQLYGYRPGRHNDYASELNRYGGFLGWNSPPHFPLSDIFIQLSNNQLDIKIKYRVRWRFVGTDNCNRLEFEELVEFYIGKDLIDTR